MAIQYSTAIWHYSPSKRKVLYAHACADCGAIRFFNMKRIKAVRCQPCRRIFEKAHPKRSPYTCKRCGVKFRAIWRSKRVPTFCSLVCLNKFQAEDGERDYVQFICKHCKQPFKVPPGIAKRGNVSCCSRRCMVAHHIWQECPYCRKQFNARHNTERVYCCKRCFLSSWGETRIEKVVRKSLHVLGLEAIPQYKVPGAHHFDFYVPSLNLLIEADGTYWHSRPHSAERDARKTDNALAKGFRVERFPEALIMSPQWFAAFRAALAKYPEFVTPKLPL